MQKTYFMLKPEVVAADDQKVGAILALVNAAGFRIVDCSMRRLETETIREFYAEHRGKPFFDALISYIGSGPVICVALARQDAARRLRELVGSTNPLEAATGTIRFLYGTSLTQNAVHASACEADAEREIQLIFGAASGGHSSG